jgi:hypothetical protein
MNKITAAINIAFKYNNTNSKANRSWVIDQMMHAILGENYEECISLFNEVNGNVHWDNGMNKYGILDQLVESRDLNPLKSQFKSVVSYQNFIMLCTPKR